MDCNKALWAAQKRTEVKCAQCGARFENLPKQSRKYCPECSYSGCHPVRGKTDLATTHPEIARQLADPSLAVGLMAGSAKEQEWVCKKCGEHFVRTVQSMVASTGMCVSCAHTGISHPGFASFRVDPGVNSADTVFPELVRFVAPDSPLSMRDVAVKSSRVLLWVCPQCGGHYERTMARQGIAASLLCAECRDAHLTRQYRNKETYHLFLPDRNAVFVFQARTHPGLVVDLDAKRNIIGLEVVGDEWRMTGSEIDALSLPDGARSVLRQFMKTEAAPTR